MNKVKISATIILLFAFVSLFANKVTKEYTTQFKQAMGYIQNEQYKDALPILMAMNELNSNANNEFNIGLCSFFLQFDKTTSLSYFDKASKNIAKKYLNTAESIQAPNETVYFQALCYHYLGQNDKAISKYEEYINNSKTMSSDKFVIADAKKKLKFIKEYPSIFTTAEHQQILNARATTKKLGPEYKSKLSKVMEVIQEDKIEAMIMLKELLKEYPNEPNINYMMGICMLNMKPYNELSTDYFMVADKNSNAFKESGIGLDCPSLVKYYSGVANQAKGDHKQALADFEAFNAIYPEEYNAFKPEFIKRMEYSRNMLNSANNTNIPSYNNQLNIVDTAGLKVLFPIMGTPITTDHTPNTNKTTTNTGDFSYYYSVQVGAGNMKESYFSKVENVRIAFYPKGMKRYVTGKYATKQEAISRMKELINLGYTDSFVTRMYGKK